jgi:class 3 adenylate cyclase
VTTVACTGSRGDVRSSSLPEARLWERRPATVRTLLLLLPGRIRETGAIATDDWETSMITQPRADDARATQHLLLCFVDLQGFARASELVDDTTLATLLDDYYALLGTAAHDAGGRLVKLIGDGALLVFPPARADHATRVLLQLREDVARQMAQLGCVLTVKLHAGDVVAGLFGPPQQRSFDVIGREVNATARIATRAFALSAEAFRALSPEGRKLFKKHTPPVTYLPTDDRRPARLGKG